MVVAGNGAAVRSAGVSWSPLHWRGVPMWPVLPPFLEEAHALATAVGPPKVAATGGRVAAVPGAVVTVPATTDARTPENVDQRRSSETTSLKTSLSFRAREGRSKHGAVRCSL